jgi:hypothetical protein
MTLGGLPDDHSANLSSILQSIGNSRAVLKQTKTLDVYYVMPTSYQLPTSYRIIHMLKTTLLLATDGLPNFFIKLDKNSHELRFQVFLKLRIEF